MDVTDHVERKIRRNRTEEETSRLTNRAGFEVQSVTERQFWAETLDTNDNGMSSNHANKKYKSLDKYALVSCLSFLSEYELLSEGQLNSARTRSRYERVAEEGDNTSRILPCHAACVDAFATILC